MRMATGPQHPLKPLRLAAAILGLCVAFGALDAFADPQPPAPGAEAPPSDAPSSSAMINLIRLLVKQGVISQTAADALLQQAQAEAAQAQALAAARTPQPVTPAEAAAAAPPPGPGVLRIPYVPEIVKNEIRDEVKQEVMAQAKSEGWAAPNLVPDWVGRIKWSGDIRFRDEFDLFSHNNANDVIDYATFNAAGPFDINPATNTLTQIPFLNTTQNREDLLSIRARLGLTAQVSDHVMVGIRLASGKDASPVSTTQPLGSQFTKKDIWLDQGYITVSPDSLVSATFGRMPDPFVRTDLVFDDNLNFDGAVANVNSPWGYAGVTGALTGGVFAIDTVPTAFPTDSQVKQSDRSKWLFAGQLVFNWTDEDKLHAKLAIADYYYDHLQGVRSTPCFLYLGVKQCSSDFTAPTFMQKGNSLFLLRNVVLNPSLPDPTLTPDPQLVGLAYNYDVFDVNGELDVRLWGQRQLILHADYARNLAYNQGKAFANAMGTIVNNFDAGVFPATGPYRSGPNAWMAKATFGDPAMDAPGAWNIALGYKYIQPDAVLDAFNDHDFHMGGTNAKGYFVFANYAFYKDAWASIRWFSANQVFGPPLAIDVLQLELNAAF